MHIWDVSSSHCTWTGCNATNIIFGWQQYDLFAAWKDLPPQLRTLKDPKYTKYSGPSNVSFEAGSRSQSIKKRILSPSMRGASYL